MSLLNCGVKNPKMFAHCILFALTIILILIQFFSCIIYVDFIYYHLRMFMHIHIFMNILSSTIFIYYLLWTVIWFGYFIYLYELCICIFEVLSIA